MGCRCKKTFILSKSRFGVTDVLARDRPRLRGGRFPDLVKGRCLWWGGVAGRAGRVACQECGVNQKTSPACRSLPSPPGPAQWGRDRHPWQGTEIVPVSLWVSAVPGARLSTEMISRGPADKARTSPGSQGWQTGIDRHRGRPGPLFPTNAQLLGLDGSTVGQPDQPC
jgi:hypothetical protein